ncbi:hypothetical protein B0T20DRAFT_418125 [Sordaria brevicollis]|uniref:Uncharacterized protein n=1 Tax=Sordaria brevicollis TaxID=83679 RepID=A0AAE0PAV7_SORBR|nr:hypothetical protein B0T20DRAFT_418125 [Sordaria brevicollis]
MFCALFLVSYCYLNCFPSCWTLIMYVVHGPIQSTNTSLHNFTFYNYPQFIIVQSFSIFRFFLLYLISSMSQD